MNVLSGRHAIVTGASRGIGRHIARALAREGVHLALVARSADDLERAREEVLAIGVDAVVVTADLADSARVASVVAEAERRLGPVDILVNNAGVERTSPYATYPTRAIERAVRVNLLAPMLLARAVLPGMLRRGRGHIVNVSSLAGKIGLPCQTPYGTTKAGLVMFSHSLRGELLDEPVGVSVICPGFVAGAGMYARVEDMGLSAPALCRPTTAEKVAAAVVRAIRDDAPELIVNPLPVRPMIALRALAPGIAPYLHRWLGNTRFVRDIAEQRSDRRESGGA